MDLLTGFDVDLAEDRRGAFERVKREEPEVLVGSPPCTMFSSLLALCRERYWKDPDWHRTYQLLLEKAARHAEFCCSLYKWQMNRGKYVVHEHPWLAQSWKLPCISKLLSEDGVMVVQGHMCAFGMRSHVEHVGGTDGPVKKPTGIMSNRWAIRGSVRRWCPGITNTFSWWEVARRLHQSTRRVCAMRFVMALVDSGSLTPA